MAEASLPLSQPRRGRPPVRGPLQRQQLMDAVARKINLDGPGSIVLVDIGAEIGLSRSSVYYYCRDAADMN
jgi:AcrR family transcriptional regulator